jgi:hypothetical protein
LAGTWSLNGTTTHYTCTSNPASLCPSLSNSPSIVSYPAPVPVTVQQNGTQLVLAFPGTAQSGVTLPQSFYTWSGKVTGRQVTFHSSYNGPINYQGVIEDTVFSISLTGAVQAENHMSGTYTQSLSLSIAAQQLSETGKWQGTWTATRSTP